MREAEHLASLSLWYSQWSSLTPSSHPNWVMVGGWDGCICICMCGDDGDEGEEVGGILIPLGGAKGGEV